MKLGHNIAEVPLLLHQILPNPIHFPMPITLKCSCGQVLNVPDSMAGKSGKCPKCKATIKIPTGGSEASPAQSKPAAAQPKPAAAQPKKSEAAASKPTAAAQAVQAAAKQADNLFDEIGLVKKTGPTCPKCGSAIARNAALCTSCGFNFQTGEQALGFNAKVDAAEFENPFLEEAAHNMRRDDLSDQRLSKAGTPWWMLASFLFGALCIGAAGVIIVDGMVSDTKQSGFLGKVQQQKFGVVAGVTFAAVGGMISTFANLSIVIFAFQQSIGRGFAVLLVPFYSFIYGCITWADNKSGIIGICLGAIIAGVGVALTISSGGIVG